MVIDENKIAEAFEQTGSTIASLVELIRLQKIQIDGLEKRIQKLESEKYMNKKRDKPYVL